MGQGRSGSIAVVVASQRQRCSPSLVPLLASLVPLLASPAVRQR